MLSQMFMTVKTS